MTSERTFRPPRRPASALGLGDVALCVRRLVVWAVIAVSLPVAVVSYVVFESAVSGAAAPDLGLTTTHVRAVLLWGAPAFAAVLPWLATPLSRREQRVATIASVLLVAVPVAFFVASLVLTFRAEP